MRINTLKSEPRTKVRLASGSVMNYQNNPDAMRSLLNRYQDNATQLRAEIRRQTKEIEVKFGRKIIEAMNEIRQIIQTGLRRDENGTQRTENNTTKIEHKERRSCSNIRANDEDEQQYAVRMRVQVQYDWWENTNLKTVMHNHDEGDHTRSEESDQSDCDFMESAVKLKSCDDFDSHPMEED